MTTTRTAPKRPYRSNEYVIAAYARLRAQGLLRKQIARRLGIHLDTLDYHLAKARKAGDPRAARVDHAGRVVAVGQLTGQGRSLVAIADALGVHERTVGRIRARLRDQGAAA